MTVVRHDGMKLVYGSHGQQMDDAYCFGRQVELVLVDWVMMCHTMQYGCFFGCELEMCKKEIGEVDINVT